MKGLASRFHKSNSMGIRDTKGPGAPSKFIIVQPDPSVPAVSRSRMMSQRPPRPRRPEPAPGHDPQGLSPAGPPDVPQVRPSRGLTPFPVVRPRGKARDRPSPAARGEGRLMADPMPIRRPEPRTRAGSYTPGAPLRNPTRGPTSHDIPSHHGHPARPRPRPGRGLGRGGEDRGHHRLRHHARFGTGQPRVCRPGERDRPLQPERPAIPAQAYQDRWEGHLVGFGPRGDPGRGRLRGGRSSSTTPATAPSTTRRSNTSRRQPARSSGTTSTRRWPRRRRTSRSC